MKKEVAIICIVCIGIGGFLVGLLLGGIINRPTEKRHKTEIQTLQETHQDAISQKEKLLSSLQLQHSEKSREATTLKSELKKLAQEISDLKGQLEHNSKEILLSNAEIVCNEFKLITKVTGSTLELSINTDLPDNTVVIVSVSRSYLQKGNSATYILDYFSESSTIGKWKTKREISIDSEKWKTALKNKQKELSKFGLGFDVASISDDIEVNMVVPINQPDPMFGERNSNLVGNAVNKTGLRVIEGEVRIKYPLDSRATESFSFRNLNPLELEIGYFYVISKQTPLMPSLDPEDPMTAIKQIKHIFQEGMIEVLETKKKRNTPWYRVNAFDQRKQKIGSGWVNSTALIGQELKVWNEETH